MPFELKMPALSPTMEEGTIARWLVGEGDIVKIGDVLAEIETDKATMEIEAIDEGRIARILVPEGRDGVVVGAVIALVVGVSEDVAVAPAEPVDLPKPDPVFESAPAHRASPADRIKVSPIADRIARAKGISLDGIKGTGPNGRITRADLGATLARPAAVPVVAPVVEREPKAPHDTVRLSSMRKTIARRLTEAKQSVPHFYLSVRCRIDALMALRVELNAALAPRGEKLSVNDIVIKAFALGLMRVPDAHVQFAGDALHRFSRADIAMAVAIDGGLVTPVIRDAGSLSLSAIAAASRSLATRARAGELTPDDYLDGTASISNLGMFGIDAMVPVINPPQAVILGVGAGREEAIAVDGQLAVGTMMQLTGSFDHRAIDGAAGAMLMAALRDLIEAPNQIVV